MTGQLERPALSEASVLDHRFGQSAPYTLGVEEEYQLLDPKSFDLVQHIDTVLAAVEGHELESRINPELMQSVLEVTTPVCRTAADVHTQLAKLRGYVSEIAREQGCRLGSAGTHPFSLFERQRITARDRYRQLVDQLSQGRLAADVSRAGCDGAAKFVAKLKSEGYSDTSAHRIAAAEGDKKYGAEAMARKSAESRAKHEAAR